MSKNTLILLLVLVAFMVRVSLIWLGRPEFVGWFNHTYYFYVQTQELLESGRLSFPDMPLLFYVYALTAKMLTWIGLETPVAIVNATRFWMCLIPSLIPIPLYAVFKSIYKETDFPKWIWALLFISAFYPLSLVHLPEFLQKNILGLLLLAILMQQSRLALKHLNVRRIIVLILVFILIVLSHYGTTAVALLYLCAFLISLWIHKRRSWTFWIGLSLMAGLAISLMTFYFLDAQRFERIISYIYRIFDSSSLGLIFSSSNSDKFTSIFMLLVPLGFVAWLYYGYKKSKVVLSFENSTFWLCNIIFCYLLLLPIYEPLLMARFVNYLTLPLIFILAFTLQNTVQRVIWKRVLIGLALFGTVLIAVGDITSLFFHNRNKELIYRDLMDMKQKNDFNEKDLIITRNGAEHVSNWFLNTKSCLITSFNIKDFDKYDRILIMNPTEGAMSLQSNTNEDAQKYNYMLSNIQEPAEAKVIHSSMHIILLQLDAPPEEWKFDNEGNWIGYN